MKCRMSQSNPAEAIAQRVLLARLVTGREVDLGGVVGTLIDSLLACARAEGVLALCARCVAGRADAAPELQARLSTAGLGLAAGALSREAACRNLLAALPDDLPLLVLKGLALGQWLYPAPYLRECSDIDLYFASRDDAERAAGLLAPLGYELQYGAGAFAHEFLCRRVSRQGGVDVDLDMHWQLSASPLFDALPTFAQWQAGSQALPSLGPGARGLGAVHAFMHAGLHRASNLSAGLGDRLKWLYDLHLLAGRFSAQDWAEVLRACRAHGLCGVCAQAMLATRAELGTVFPEATLQSLMAAARDEVLDANRLQDWSYIQRLNFRALGSWRRRARWLWERAFPSEGYLHELYGADVSRRGLWWARIRRAVGRLFGRLPA